jgi:hypothetical protein
MRILISALLFLLLSIGNAQAQSNSGLVQISTIRAGWSADTFAIETGQAIVNPANCSAPDGYMVAISDPGYKTFYAAALMAFSTGKSIIVIISNNECSSMRPKIIGIHVQK